MVMASCFKGWKTRLMRRHEPSAARWSRACLQGTPTLPRGLVPTSLSLARAASPLSGGASLWARRAGKGQVLPCALCSAWLGVSVGWHPGLAAERPGQPRVAVGWRHFRAASWRRRKLGQSPPSRMGLVVLRAGLGHDCHQGTVFLLSE